jgi:hypothetical protein
MPETTFAVSHSDFTKIWFVPTFDLRLWVGSRWLLQERELVCAVASSPGALGGAVTALRELAFAPGR